MKQWLENCNTGWLQTIDSKEPNALTRKFAPGYFTLAFQIVDLENHPKVGDLLNNISRSAPGLYEPKLWAYPEDYKERPKIIAENTFQSYIGGQEGDCTDQNFGGHVQTDSSFQETGTLKMFKQIRLLVRYSFLRHQFICWLLDLNMRLD